MPGRHPCPWCTWDERDNLDDIGKWELRGATQHALQYEEFCREYGGLKENSKLCKGVENPTVFQDTGILPRENMAILNLPELHLMLGVGQRLYDVILESMSEDEIRIHQDSLKRYKRLLLKHHGDLFLNRNCNAFIALRRFDYVVSSCFGRARSTTEFHEKIFEFEELTNVWDFLYNKSTYSMPPSGSIDAKTFTYR